MGHLIDAYSSTQRNLEIALFSTIESYYSSVPVVLPLPTNPLFLRMAEVRVFDRNLLTADIENIQNYRYQLSEALLTEPTSGAYIYSYQALPDLQTSDSFNINLSFSNSTAYISALPELMNFNSPQQPIIDTKNSVCWSHH